MSSWTSGYVADINYTYGFYRELTPALLNFVALAKGQQAPDPAAPLTYCELGCGQGFTANLLAAANPNIEFYANDFNPTQIANARATAAAGGLSNIHFSDASFEEYLADESLPQFDYITLHGIFTWVSVENRKFIVEFIRKRLKVGGLVYISFNVLPGWASGMPLRRLFTDHAKTTGGPLSSRVEKALMFADRLKAANVAYFRDTAGAGKRLENIHTQNRSYLAHEYFNRDWTPFYFADVAEELDGAKLGYLGSAHLLDHVDGLNLLPDHQTLLNEIAEPRFKETARDYFTLQQFRRDVFSRGIAPLHAGEYHEAWLDARFALIMPRSKVELKMMSPLGEMGLSPEVYNPLLDSLAAGPKTVRQLVAEKALLDLGWARLQEGLKVLIGANYVAPCLDAKGDAKRAQRTKAFNAAIMKRSPWTTELVYLASPVTGSALPVDRFQQMFMLGLQEKLPDVPQEVWNQLEKQGQKLLKDGKAIENPEDNLAELRERFDLFQKLILPLLKQLGIP